jgi:outer membrane receptor protein involved in Fe transport
MVGDIDFYPGVARARYGRKTGGTVAGQAANHPLKPGLHGELELRLIDMQAYAATPIGDGGRLEIGGRYGYPGLAFKAVNSRSVLQYWDYQARTTIPLTRDTKLQVVALGSYDMVGERTDHGFERYLELQFHRLELRAITHLSRVDVGYALGFGYERSGLGDNFEVTALRMGPKLWLDTRIRNAKVRFGADMLATSGRIGDPSDDGEGGPVFEQNPVYRSAAGRSVTGLYTEVNVPLAPRWDLEAGLRGDLWITGGRTEQAIEPRLLLRHQVHELVTLHAAFGLGYQPAVFLIPLPGVADVTLDRGLQRAVQQEVGTAIDLPASFRAETKFFFHLYDHMLSVDAIENDQIACDQGPGSCGETDTFARMSAYAYGAEFLLRRSYKERFSGWLAYTLSKADGHTESGRPLTPSFDVRHVANLVLQWRISRGVHASMRGYAQSGRFPFAASTSDDPQQRQRLPMFVRGDLQVSRLWARRWGELRFTFDWLNFTLQREPTGWKCPEAHEPQRACKVQYSPFPVTIPMLGVRGTY